MWCAYITSKPSTMLCRLPPIAKPYMKDEAWSWDLLQCFLRLADGICKVSMSRVKCSVRMTLLQGSTYSALCSCGLHRS